MSGPVSVALTCEAIVVLAILLLAAVIVNFGSIFEVASNAWGF